MQSSNHTKQEAVERMLAGEGALGKARDEEPIFVLRAKDRFAPLLVQTWCDLMREHASPGAAEKIEDAQRCSASMLAYQAAHGAKVPD